MGERAGGREGEEEGGREKGMVGGRGNDGEVMGK